MIILGIETSCDETSAAIVENGSNVLSSVVFSQIPQHQCYGGVVPEIASRAHVEVLPDIIEKSVLDAGLVWEQIDAVAVTRGPGLASSLLIGLSAAKSLALRLQKPLIGVNHLRGHLYSIFLEAEKRLEEICPFVALLVSGGHTCLVKMEGVNNCQLLGQTLDDAAGEAFDKGACLLGLGYPGGPLIEKAGKGGNINYVKFPRGLSGSSATGDRKYSFSFSGLKTSLRYYLEEHPLDPENDHLSDLAASYQEAILDALLIRFEKALDAYPVKNIACVGGVACNRNLRDKLTKLAEKRSLDLYLASPKYCTDNAAMIAGLAGNYLVNNNAVDFEFDIIPNLSINEA